KEYSKRIREKKRHIIHYLAENQFAVWNSQMGGRMSSGLSFLTFTFIHSTDAFIKAQTKNILDHCRTELILYC
ncbi:MAG: hypothetical protein ACRCZO_13635, partial [Cetobacterium sp.]